MQQLTYMLTDNSVTILDDDFRPKTMPVSHPAFEQVVDAIKANDVDVIRKLMDLPAAIASFMQGKVQIVERTLFFDGKPLHNSLTQRILQFMEDGNPELAKPLINFLEKVRENPSRRAAEGLYDWSVRSNLPITSDGDILAWKIVRDDYKDCHSNSFDNSVGQVVEVPRNEVDEDPDRTCSYGLHFCSTEYLPTFGSYNANRRVMVVKLHPKDVVAFPRDYNVSKGRACRYEVLGEVPAEKAKDFFPSLVSDYQYRIHADNDDDFAPLEDGVEVGCYYRTRDGSVAYVERYDDETTTFCFSGTVNDETGYTWTEHGSWNGSDEHPFDLMELLPDGAVEEEQPKPTGGWLSQLISGLLN